MSSAQEFQNRGMQLALQEKESEAIKQFEKAKELSPNLEGVSHRLAVLYDRTGNWDAARREYLQALKTAPNNSNLLNDYGYFLYSQGELQEAEKQLDKCLKLEPNHKTAHVNLGLVLAALEDYEGAFFAFETAVGAAAAHQNVGLLLAQNGQNERAIVSFNKAKEIDSSLKLSEQVISHLNASPDQDVPSPIKHVSHVEETPVY